MAKKKSSNKLADSLTAYFSAYKALEETLQEDYGTESSNDLSAALVGEVSSALETVLDSDEFSPTFVGSSVKILIEALEDLDPEMFEASGKDEDKDTDDDSSEDDEEIEDEDELFEDR